MSSTQPCGSKLATVNQEREQAIFRKGSKGSGGITGRPPTFGVLPCVYHTNMEVRTEKSDLRVVNIGLEVRKSRRRRAPEDNNWVLRQLLASHPSMAFLVMKQRYLPKMNENRCKTNVRGSDRAVRGPENFLLSTVSVIRPRSGPLRPQCPSKGSK